MMKTPGMTLHETVHSTTRYYTPTQLVFGWDSILNIRYKASWQIIKQLKQDLINKEYRQENFNQRDNTRTSKGTKSYL